jgi:hypothetical protein
MTLALPPLLLVNLLASLGRGSDGFLSSVGLNGKRVDCSQRDELALERSVFPRKIIHMRITHRALSGAYE